MYRRGWRDRARSLLLICLLALAFTGCGGGRDGVATTSGRSLEGSQGVVTPSTDKHASSSPDFIANADAICARINTKIAAVKAKSGSAKEVERVVPQHASVERAGLAELEELAPPPPLTRSWQAMLGYRRALARELDELVADAKRKDIAASKTLEASKKRLHGVLRKTAKARGFVECAEVG